MFNPLLVAALGFLAGMAFLALGQYVIRSLGARRGSTVPSIRPTVEPIRPEVEPFRPAFDAIRPTVESIRPTAEDTWPAVEGIQPAAEGIRPTAEEIPPGVGSARPWESADDELIAVLAAAASETLQAPLRVLSYQVEPKR